MRELQNLEDFLKNLMDSGSEQDYHAVMEELNDLEYFAGSLVKTRLDYEEELVEEE